MIELTVTATRSHLVHAATMLRSLCHAMPDESSRVHLLHDGDLRTADLDLLRASLEPFEIAINPVTVPIRAISRLPKHRFHPSAWFRVLLADLEPEVDRALHIDVDAIVLKHLRQLWETDLDDHLFAASINPLYPFQPDHYRTVLGLESEREYLNSGVMLMDLNGMRREGIPEKLIHYGETHPENNWPEQDALAVVCRGRWLELHPKWNVQTTFYDLDGENLPYSSETLAEALADPAIVHFIGPYKPWTHACQHPLRHLYHHTRSQTAYPPAERPSTRRMRSMRRLREEDRARLSRLEYRARKSLRWVKRGR